MDTPKEAGQTGFRDRSGRWVDEMVQRHEKPLDEVSKRMLQTFAPAAWAVGQRQTLDQIPTHSTPRKDLMEAIFHVGAMAADTLSDALPILVPSPLTVGLKLFYNVIAPTVANAAVNRIRG